MGTMEDKHKLPLMALLLPIEFSKHTLFNDTEEGCLLANIFAARNVQDGAYRMNGGVELETRQIDSYENMVRQILKEFTEPSALVCDPMAGTGLHLALAKEMGRDVIGFDRNPQWCNQADGITMADSTKKIPAKDCDIVLTSIFYWKKSPWDSGNKFLVENSGTYEQYLEKIEKFANNCKKALRQGGYFAVIEGVDYEKPIKKDFHLIFKRVFTPVKMIKFISANKLLDERIEDRLAFAMVYQKR